MKFYDLTLKTIKWPANAYLKSKYSYHAKPLKIYCPENTDFGLETALPPNKSLLTVQALYSGYTTVINSITADEDSMLSK